MRLEVISELKDELSTGDVLRIVHHPAGSLYSWARACA
jgi:hypothetical protein